LVVVLVRHLGSQIFGTVRSLAVFLQRCNRLNILLKKALRNAEVGRRPSTPKRARAPESAGAPSRKNVSPTSVAQEVTPAQSGAQKVYVLSDPSAKALGGATVAGEKILAGVIEGSGIGELHPRHLKAALSIMRDSKGRNSAVTQISGQPTIQRGFGNGAQMDRSGRGPGLGDEEAGCLEPWRGSRAARGGIGSQTRCL
jgi:hypothetical protein